MVRNFKMIINPRVLSSEPVSDYVGGGELCKYQLHFLKCGITDELTIFNVLPMLAGIISHLVAFFFVVKN